MAILLDDKPTIPNDFATPAKSRLLSTLVRHVSAPASPLLSLDAFSPSEGSLSITKPHLFTPLRPSAAVSRSKQSLLSELSLAQSLASRLRRDRDNWRSLAQKQVNDNTAAENTIKERAHAISSLEDRIADLHHRNEEDRSKGKQLYTRFQGLITKHDKLVDDLNEALRTINRLKKSDRAKGKVQQRNLRLKATLQHYTSREGGSSTLKSDASVEATLLEALALANERIEELESKGKGLLDLLEERKDSSGSDTVVESEEEDVEEGLREAKFALREVIEDEAFTEQKANWAELLDE
ncbi:Nn.00g100920.m01.CDS01 [Neocucurbitaria sp. VM-36]